MICRGIIETIISRYEVKVRIPLIHKSAASSSATTSDALPSACICTLPSTHPNVQIGDIVIVGFENNDTGKPIILGYLYKENFNETAITPILDSLSVRYSATLPTNTTIGDIDSKTFTYLSGLEGNIQKQLDILEERIKLLEKTPSNNV